MNDAWIVATAFVVFGSAAFLGVQSGKWMVDRIEPFDDGPPPGKPNVWLLIGGSALVGALMAYAGQEPGVMLGRIPHFALIQLMGFAAIAYAMVACWYTDVSTGIVPDVFTLGTLGGVTLVLIATGDLAHIVMMILVSLPFVIAALFSKGRGMGWGDVKIVALVGASIGFSALLAVAGACLVAVLVAFIRRKRNEPIAFAPYLIGAIGFCVSFPQLVPQGVGF